MTLDAARQEWHLARKHYQQVLRDWHILPLETRDSRLEDARCRRRDAFSHYILAFLAA